MDLNALSIKCKVQTVRIEFQWNVPSVQTDSDSCTYNVKVTDGSKSLTVMEVTTRNTRMGVDLQPSNSYMVAVESLVNGRSVSASAMHFKLGDLPVFCGEYCATMSVNEQLNPISNATTTFDKPQQFIAGTPAAFKGAPIDFQATPAAAIQGSTTFNRLINPRDASESRDRQNSRRDDRYDLMEDKRSRDRKGHVTGESRDNNRSPTDYDGRTRRSPRGRDRDAYADYDRGRSPPSSTSHVTAAYPGRYGEGERRHAIASTEIHGPSQLDERSHVTSWDDQRKLSRHHVTPLRTENRRSTSRYGDRDAYTRCARNDDDDRIERKLARSADERYHSRDERRRVDRERSIDRQRRNDESTGREYLNSVDRIHLAEIGEADWRNGESASRERAISSHPANHQAMTSSAADHAIPFAYVVPTTAEPAAIFLDPAGYAPGPTNREAPLLPEPPPPALLTNYEYSAVNFAAHSSHVTSTMQQQYHVSDDGTPAAHFLDPQNNFIIDKYDRFITASNNNEEEAASFPNLHIRLDNNNDNPIGPPSRSRDDVELISLDVYGGQTRNYEREERMSHDHHRQQHQKLDSDWPTVIVEDRSSSRDFGGWKRRRNGSPFRRSAERRGGSNNTRSGGRY